MTDRVYSRITALCLFVAMASAIAFDYARGGLKLVVFVAAAFSASVAIASYFYRVWNDKPERMLEPAARTKSAAEPNRATRSDLDLRTSTSEPWEDLAAFCNIEFALNAALRREAMIRILGVAESEGKPINQSYIGPLEESQFVSGLAQLITQIVSSSGLRSSAEISITRHGRLSVEWPTMTGGQPILSPGAIRVVRPILQLEPGKISIASLSVRSKAK